MYVLVCDEPVINNSCSTGFTSVQLSEITPEYMTIEQLEAVLPATLLFFVACYCWKKLNQ